MLLLSSADFYQNYLAHYQSVKLFGSRSGPTLCRSLSGSKLFAKVKKLLGADKKVAPSKNRIKNLMIHILFFWIKIT